ncbi:HDIG domain protein [delta proteobacterium NaphS2]|nr:HDIG domain protein [delta proteobacterium NaphS2]
MENLAPDTRVSGCYLVKSKKLSTTRNGNPFLSLTLADKTGDLPAKVWDRAEALSPLFHEGEVVEVTGRSSTYQGQLQLTISELRPSPERPDPEKFLESSPFDIPVMIRSLRTVLNQVRDIHLKALIDLFWKDRKFMSLFRKAPAAKNFHHGYLGGLLEHTLSVCRLAAQVSDHYPALNKDLLITAAFLHDVGKTREFSWGMNIDYTDEGRLVGHLVLGVAILDEKLGSLKDFPDEWAIRLKHLILSHHGQYDFGSPKEPKFLEAFALHLLDDLDAKINGLHRFMERDGQEGSWTEFNRLFRKFFFKGPFPGTLEPEERRETKVHQQGMLFSPDF